MCFWGGLVILNETVESASLLALQKVALFCTRQECESADVLSVVVVNLVSSYTSTLECMYRF